MILLLLIISLLLQHVDSFDLPSFIFDLLSHSFFWYLRTTGPNTSMPNARPQRVRRAPRHMTRWRQMKALERKSVPRQSQLQQQRHSSFPTPFQAKAWKNFHRVARWFVRKFIASSDGLNTYQMFSTLRDEGLRNGNSFTLKSCFVFLLELNWIELRLT